MTRLLVVVLALGACGPTRAPNYPGPITVTAATAQADCVTGRERILAATYASARIVLAASLPPECRSEYRSE